jgi:uncharacterized iron-regulated membrane protein
VEVPGLTPAEGRWHQVSIDPHTGAVLGVREWEKYLTSLIYRLHYTLLLGPWGQWTVGISQALLINTRASRTPLNFDLHRVGGTYTALVLLVVGFSGVYMLFPTYVKALVRLLSPATEFPKDLQSTPLPERPPITPTQAIAVADTVFPDAELTYVHLTSLAPEGVYAVYKRQPGEVRKSGGASVVRVDQYSGAVLDVRNPRTMSAGNRFILWQLPLHNG